MILGIDHIGVATSDPAGVGVFLTALGLRRTDAGVADAYGVACEFWQLPGGGSDMAAAGGGSSRAAAGGGGPAVELVAPVREDSAVAGRLAASGPGLYHIAFTVDDIEAELARLRRDGFVAVDRAPCAGARPGMRVAFMYLRRPAALLIELVRYQPVDRA